MALLLVKAGHNNGLLCQRLCNTPESCGLNKGQIAGQDQPACGLSRGLHAHRDGLPHAAGAALGPNKMPRQARSVHRLKSVREHRFAVEQRIKLVGCATRREKPLAPSSRQYNHYGQSGHHG